MRHGRSLFPGGHHGRPEFFTVGRNLAHGDNPYNRWTLLGHNNVPIHRIFLNNAQIESLIDSPAPLPGKDVPQTAAFHAGNGRDRGVALHDDRVEGCASI